MAAALLFCDTGSMTPALRELEQRGLAVLATAPEQATASGPGRPRMQDLFLRTGALPAPPAGDAPSPLYEAILSVLGFEHRREAALLDAAATRGCVAFVTQDSDILRRRERLEALLAVRCFHPFRDEAAIIALVSAGAEPDR